jgi:O-antigen/teichoic acid export membrane protein
MWARLGLFTKSLVSSSSKVAGRTAAFRILGLLLGVLVTPIYVRNIGLTGMGIVSILFSITAIVNLLDNFALIVVSREMLLSEKRREIIALRWTKASWILSLVVVGSIVLPITHFVKVGSNGVVIALTTFLLLVPSIFGFRIRQGYGEVDVDASLKYYSASVLIGPFLAAILSTIWKNPVAVFTGIMLPIAFAGIFANRTRVVEFSRVKLPLKRFSNGSMNVYISATLLSIILAMPFIIDPWLVSKFLNIESAGALNIVIKIATPLVTIGSIVNTVLAGQVSRIRRARDAVDLFGRGVAVMSAISFATLLLGILLGPEIVSFLSNGEFAPSEWLVITVVVASYLSFIPLLVQTFFSLRPWIIAFFAATLIAKICIFLPLVSVLGLLAAPLSTVISLLVFALVPMIFLARPLSGPS